MEKCKVTVMVALDLSAAFDTVNHKILLDVLESRFGVTEMALKWIGEYLKDKHFSVQISNALSDPVCIYYSVPKGSILGPVLLHAVLLHWTTTLRTGWLSYQVMRMTMH